jgi:hypothetical protein
MEIFLFYETGKKQGNKKESSWGLTSMTNTFFLSIYPIEFKTLFTNQLLEWNFYSFFAPQSVYVCVVCCGDEEGGDQSEFGTKANFQLSLRHLAAHKLMMFPQHDSEKSWAMKLVAPSS